MPQCDRFWLLTWTTYGTWLPGDDRGFVGSVRDERGAKVSHNVIGTDPALGLTPLKQFAKSLLKCDPVLLTLKQAEAVYDQIHETAALRRWQMVADAIMRNHIHIVVAVPGDPNPDKVLGDFKAYASRRLNRGWGKPASSTWWTQRGSTRKLKDELGVLAGARYVRDQPGALVVRVDPAFAPELGNDPETCRRHELRLATGGANAPRLARRNDADRSH